MHAKHDYNPVKTAYPVDSVPEFNEHEYPKVTPDGRSPEGERVPAPFVLEDADRLQSEEDLILLHKTQQAAFHQSRDYQGAQAYKKQGYEPTSTELESTISWGLLVGCAIVVLFLLVFGGGILSLFLI
jgi:hypothetical protein